MADRIPPRVDTPVITAAFGWSPPLLPITLSIDGQGGGNGEATIDGNPTASITGLSIVKLRGTVQTDPGNGGNLRLVARMGGSVLATSAGFSVSAIPRNWTCTFDSLLTGPDRGFVVNDSWESDSGVVADLDQTEISEEVQYGAGTGCFAGVGTNNSGYLPGNVFTQDTHGAPTSILTGPGVIVAQQTSQFIDHRSGSTDIPMENAGYTIARIVLLAGPGSFLITTGKVGATTTANGVRSAAGVGSIIRTQAV